MGEIIDDPGKEGNIIKKWGYSGEYQVEQEHTIIRVL